MEYAPSLHPGNGHLMLVIRNTLATMNNQTFIFRSTFNMNRIQFWILSGLSGLVLLLMVAQVALVRQTGDDQNRNLAAQQIIAQGQASQSMFTQVARRIASDSQA